MKMSNAGAIGSKPTTTTKLPQKVKDEDKKGDPQAAQVKPQQQVEAKTTDMLSLSTGQFKSLV
jgi:hypothetical protein